MNFSTFFLQLEGFFGRNKQNRVTQRINDAIGELLPARENAWSSMLMACPTESSEGLIEEGTNENNMITCIMFIFGNSGM